MEYKIPPWKHQLEAIERARVLPWFCLFFEMGAGKSAAAIHILRHKVNQRKKMQRTIVFCPPIVVPNWKEEFIKNSKIPSDQIVMLDGSGKKRLQLFQESGASVFITNYESLLMEELFDAFQKWKPEFLIFDESHKLKNYKAERSKFAEKLANPVKFKDPVTREWKVDLTQKPIVLLLSGSPVLNSPMDLFYPFLIMDGGTTFGSNFFIFRARFFVDKNAGMPKDRYFPAFEVRPGALDQINSLIFQAGMRVTKAECLDLPEEVSVTLKSKMLPAQAKHYREMKQDFIAFQGESTATATLAIVKALRLMQITSGFLPLNPTGDEMDVPKVVYKDTPKEDNLRELLAELTPHSKVIVWAVWKANYEVIRRICEELGLGYVEVHGGISAAQQKRNVDVFKSDASARVFIGHPGSGGIGINLTCAPYSIFYSRTFSLEHWLQARARNHRGGQTEKVTHFDLVCENTIDELVTEKLAQKFDMSGKLLGDFALALRNQRD